MSHGEGLTTHTSPESCMGSGNNVGEALTRENAGWVLSLVIGLSPGADVLQFHRRRYLVSRYGEGYKDLAGSETSCMHGSYLRGNREALYLTLKIAVGYALKILME